MLCLFTVVFLLMAATSEGQVINAMLVFPAQVPVQLQFATTRPAPPPAHPRPPPSTVSHPNCGNQALGQIISANIKREAAVSARAVEVAVRERFKGPWYVSCGYDEMFFSKSSPSYCEVERDGVYCYAFRPYRL